MTPPPLPKKTPPPLPEPEPKAPPAGRKFPCRQCGARLDFDPAARVNANRQPARTAAHAHGPAISSARIEQLQLGRVEGWKLAPVHLHSVVQRGRVAAPCRSCCAWR